MANAGNIALLERAELLGLLPAGVGHAAASAYRTMRRVQHRARLDEAPSHVAPESLQPEINAILTLWHTVFTPQS
jgi:glutamate-ammonia-ligase adenylyltransferase